MRTLLLLLLFTSCHSHVDVSLEPYARKRLASVAVDSPDPLKSNPKYGQRLNVSWSVDNKTFQEAPTELLIQIRYRDGDIRDIHTPLEKRSGTEQILIVGSDFKEKGGLLSYRVALLSQGKVLDEKLHKLWVTPIVVKE